MQSITVCAAFNTLLLHKTILEMSLCAVPAAACQVGGSKNKH